MDEWVEAEGQTAELAVAVAMEELGISSVEDAEVEILQESKQGFLGIGAQDAVVKVSRKPKPKRNRRRRRTSGSSEASTATAGGGDNNRARPQPKGKGSPGRANRSKKTDQGRKREVSAVTAPEVDIEDQAGLAKKFLEGLLEAFGLEGEVTTRVEDSVLFLDVVGDQTEALVGPKGAILQAINELTRTVIQRKTFRAPRMRLDISGYNEGRRAALKIFASQMAEKVKEGGSEVMLEPMNPADRKVLHDAVSEIDGVRSYSEGEDPKRSVVIAAD
jgi:spoIIIJ-associated protein